MRNFGAQRFPHIHRGQAAGNHIAAISRHVQKCARAQQRLVAHGDEPDGRTDTRAENSQVVVTLAFQPAKSPSDIQHRLPVRLQRESNIRTYKMIAARMIWNRAAVVIRQAHLHRRDPQTIEPPANILLLLPTRVPLRQHDDRRTRVPRAKNLRVHAIVSRPGRFNRARERENIVGQQIVVSRRDGIPFITVLECVLHKSVEEAARVGFFRVAADVFQPPCKRKRAPVGFLRPAHVFVPPYLLFEPSHGMQTIEYIVEPRANQIASARLIRFGSLQ